MSSSSLNLLEDVYYSKHYSELYLTGSSSLFEFEYCDADREILFRSIKSPITSVAGSELSQELYDLESHYGYSGPFTNCLDLNFLKSAFAAYKEECIRQKIVCEFIRFHPFNTLGSISEIFDFHLLDREVVVVDLEVDSAVRWADYSKTTRNILRRTADKLSLACNQISTEDFEKLYVATMDKNDASDFYYFDSTYFKKLKAIRGVDLLSVHLEKELVSCGFFMVSKDLAHYHLSANNSVYQKEHGNYALLDFAFEHAKSVGCKKLMLGGGRTSSVDDPLFKFKAKFSDNYLPFYIAGIDFMPDVKAILNQLWQEKNPGRQLKLFQKYRAV